MEHTCLSTFILCLNLFLKLITSQRKHYNVFREVKPELLKLLLFKSLNQLADICTNESHAMVELKLFLHRKMESAGFALMVLLGAVCAEDAQFTAFWMFFELIPLAFNKSRVKLKVLLRYTLGFWWWEVSGGAGGLKGGCTKLVLRVLTVSGRRTKLLPQESVGEFCCFLVHQNRWYHIQLGCEKGSYQSGPWQEGLELNWAFKFLSNPNLSVILWSVVLEWLKAPLQCWCSLWCCSDPSPSVEIPI